MVPSRLAVLFNDPCFAQNEGVSPSLPLLRDQPLTALVSDPIKKRFGPEALATTLLENGWIPDNLGELHNLTHKQARAIRAAGYSAQASQRRWRCPTLPDQLVCSNALWHLSDALPRFFGYRQHLAEWAPYRSHPIGDRNAGRFGQTSAAHHSSPYCPRCGYGRVQTATNARTHV